MFAVIFEVQPKTGKFDDYLDLAKFLKPKLEAIEGFIDNERFESKRSKGRVLSLSTWADEKAVIRWRTQGEHHGVQEKGRFEVFEDYHLRVGEITADTGPPKGIAVREQRFDATEIGKAKVVNHHGTRAAGEERTRRSGRSARCPSRAACRHGRAHRSGGLREHLQSRQAVDACGLARRRGRRVMDADET
jgi:heme-degrading monooxygenase HmoA